MLSLRDKVAASPLPSAVRCRCGRALFSQCKGRIIVFTKCCITPKFALNVALTATLAMYLGGCGHAIRVGNVGWLFAQVCFRAFCRNCCPGECCNGRKHREKTVIWHSGEICVTLPLNIAIRQRRCPKGPDTETSNMSPRQPRHHIHETRKNNHI